MRGCYNTVILALKDSLAKDLTPLCRETLEEQLARHLAKRPPGSKPPPDSAIKRSSDVRSVAAQKIYKVLVPIIHEMRKNKIAYSAIADEVARRGIVNTRDDLYTPDALRVIYVKYKEDK